MRLSQSKRHKSERIKENQNLASKKSKRKHREYYKVCEMVRRLKFEQETGVHFTSTIAKEMTSRDRINKKLLPEELLTKVGYYEKQL